MMTRRSIFACETNLASVLMSVIGLSKAWYKARLGRIGQRPKMSHRHGTGAKDVLEP